MMSSFMLASTISSRIFGSYATILVDQVHVTPGFHRYEVASKHRPRYLHLPNVPLYVDAGTFFDAGLVQNTIFD
ncbi:hypothetical protein F4815DRAFT_486342, partial [Daldinia loculata]